MSNDNEKSGASVSDDTVTAAGAGAEGRRSSFKYVVRAISLVLLSSMILIGVLVGIYLFTDAFSKIVTQSLKTKENTHQETSADVTSNLIEYDVRGKGGNAVYIDDYNSFLRVVKLETDSGVVCYVGHMNGTKKVDLTMVGKTTAKNETDNKVSYERIGDPIPDTSFMNKKARTMCKGISTYWVQHSCHSPAENHREKRGLCYYCPYVCYWNYDYYYDYYYECYFVCYLFWC